MTINHHDLTILPFQPADQSEVKSLILSGLADHWGTLDPARNPDLNDIKLSYANAVFLVARLNERIIGTGALIPRSEKIAEIVRMSVASDQRRKGVGKMILQKLVDQARLDGLDKLILETTESWSEVIEFYLRLGFQITHHLNGDVYFEMDLSDPKY